MVKSNLLKNNKGAMFGLDARIALAIFGALSVISGAALYSAIQSAKSEQYRQFFLELNKASEAYYLDTGSQLSGDNILNVFNLISNDDSVNGWNGPYLNGGGNGIGTLGFVPERTGERLGLNSANASTILLKTGSNWSSNSSVTDGDCVVNDNDCYEYASLTGAGNWGLSRNSNHVSYLIKVFNMVDELVDNGNGALTGNVRLINAASDTNTYVLYKGMKHIRR